MGHKTRQPSAEQRFALRNHALSKRSKKNLSESRKAFLDFKAYSIDEALQMDTLSNWESFLT